MLTIKKNGYKIEYIFSTLQTAFVDYDDVAENRLLKRLAPKDETQDTQTRAYNFEARSRAKRTVIEYGLNNDWTYFLTLTFDAKKVNRDNKDELLRQVVKSFNNYRNRLDSTFRYLLLPEYHRDGKHVHFHGLVLCSDTYMIPKYDARKKKTYYQNAYFFDRFGATRFDILPESEKEYTTYYITKYVTKSATKIYPCYYYASKGLQRSKTLYKTSSSETALLAYLCGMNEQGENYAVYNGAFASVYSTNENIYNILAQKFFLPKT